MNVKEHQEIEALVEVMNGTGWLKVAEYDTVRDESTSGGSDSVPYIAFYCQINKLDYLCMLMDNAAKTLQAYGEDFYFIQIPLEIMYDSDLKRGQNTAPPGYISLKLELWGVELLSPENKAEVLSALRSVFASATKLNREEKIDQIN